MNNNTNWSGSGPGPLSPFDWPDEYSPRENLALAVLNIVELLGHLLLECPSSALNFHLIFSTSVLHPNLKFILLCQSTSIFTRGIGRTVLLIFRFWMKDIDWRGTVFLQYFYGTAIFVRNILAHAMVMERIMATVCVKRYEQWRKPYFTIAWFTIAVTASMINVTSLISMPLGDPSFSNWLLSGVMAPAFCLFECVALYWLWHHNDKLYQNKYFTVHDLNERYQLAENIRTAKQLTPTLFLHFVNIFVNALLSWSAFCFLFSRQFYYVLANQSAFTLVTYNNFCIELTMIMYHPFLRRSLSKMWHNLWRRLSMNRVGARVEITGNNSNKNGVAMRDLRGVELIRKQGQDEHFEQLNAVWSRGSGGGEGAQNAGGKYQKRRKTTYI